MRESTRTTEAEPQFDLTDDTYRKPDLFFRPTSLLMPKVRGPDALLVNFNSVRLVLAPG